MNSPKPPRALIKTIELYNGNYGGILQNYALQRVIDSLGFEAWTDAAVYPTLGKRAMHVVKPMARRFAPHARAPSRLPATLARHIVDGELESFVDSKIRTINLSRGGSVRMSVLNEIDVLIAGSDQIWRHEYTDVTANLFDFAEGIDIPKVAYAGSFGTGGLDGYSPELISRSRELARKFDAVSVRESSAVALCSAAWGVEATHVLDPTMLLGVEHYDALIAEGSPDARSAGYVFDYTLDASPANRALTDAVARRTGVDVRRGMPPVPPTYAEAKHAPGTYAKPSPYEWLRGFRDAEFVVTDSFHGTVFSILFQRPFLSILNSSRGAERFVSLLTMFGLEDRLVRDGSVSESAALEPDWEQVRERLHAERRTSLRFLRGALGLTT